MMKKTIGLVILGVIALGSALAFACGSEGDGAATPTVVADGGGAAGGALPAGGMVAPGQYMTFDGQRYELVNLLYEETKDEFEAVGEITQSDVDVSGDSRVFRRAGDSENVYTRTLANEEDPGFWMTWRPIS